MRRLGSMFLAFILVIGFAPTISFALSNEDLASFLEEEGLTEEQLNDHLSRFWGLTVEEFESVEELGDFLGERITNENLQVLLDEYSLSSDEELVALLVENGEMELSENLRDAFIYIDALNMTTDFYSGTAVTDESLQLLLEDYGLTLEELNEIFVANEDSVESYSFIEDLEDMLYVYGLPLNEKTLEILLNDYGLTLEELNNILTENGDSLENYDRVDDLEYALLDYGLPLTEQNLQELLDGYELTREQLDALLAKYDDSIENYETIDELYFSVLMYMVLEEGSDELLNDLGIGLDEQELVNLLKHFMTIDFLDPAFMDKMDEIDARLAAFGEFDSADDLTPEQMNELIQLYDEMMSLFGLDAKYYLVKGTERIALSEQEALTLEKTNGYDLLIELYNQEGGFLADVILTADLFGSDLIEKIEEQIETVDEAAKTTPVKQESKDVRTVNGGKLPNTAGNYAEGLLAGFVLMGIGAFWFRKRTVKHS